MFRYADRFAETLGIQPKERQLNLETLYLSTEKAPAAYWLQLMVATGIAHMGLVLDSTAVLIGAMLVSPLMTPIVQVAMGFAIGHLHLTLRALGRLSMSIFVVVLFAAITTHLLPFQEETREILGRTAPTFLDLIVALFCGLAAAFTTARGSKDTVTAAAGTAIAIALVPPLCVVGVGVGMANSAIALGAGLLFTANLAAIILVGDLFFLLTGFSHVDMERLEQRVYSEDDKQGISYRLARSIPVPGSISRSLWLRLSLPLTFVALVSLPLSRALSQVVWEVRVKGAVNAYLAKIDTQYNVLTKQLSVRPGVVSLRMSVVDDPENKEALKHKLTEELAALAGLVPSVDLRIIPSDEAVGRRLQKSSARLAQQLAAANSVDPVECPPVPPPVDVEQIKQEAAQAAATAARLEASKAALAGVTQSQHAEHLRSSVGAVLAWAAPKAPAGCAWLGWSLAVGPQGTRLELRLLADQPLDAGIEHMLAAILARETGLQLAGVRVTQRPVTLLEAPPSAPDAVHIPALRRALKWVKLENLRVHLTVPDPAATKGRRAQAAITAKNTALRATLLETLGEAPTPTLGTQWSLVVALPAVGAVDIATKPPAPR